MKALMLVSARAGAALRAETAAMTRPRPEFLELERRGVALLDWTRLPGRPRRRSPATSAIHVASALRRLSEVDAVFSDGEHVGLPLALAMRAAGRRIPHVMLAHHLTNGSKAALVRRLRLDRRIDRIVTHSPRQLDMIRDELGVPGEKLRFDPYFADTSFWTPQPAPEEPVLVAAGLEHRDYRTLAEAWTGRPERVHVAAGSVHSPKAAARLPEMWPDNFKVGPVDHLGLRSLYARAQVVVVPVVDSDFQAGVTTVLEAMAMGKAVVATAARGWSGVIEDGETGLLVKPGDAGGLRRAVTHLIQDPVLRSRLGRNARRVAVRTHSVEAYAARLLGHLDEIAHRIPAAA